MGRALRDLSAACCPLHRLWRQACRHLQGRQSDASRARPSEPATRGKDVAQLRVARCILARYLARLYVQRFPRGGRYKVQVPVGWIVVVVYPERIGLDAKHLYQAPLGLMAFVHRCLLVTAFGVERCTSFVHGWTVCDTDPWTLPSQGRELTTLSTVVHRTQSSTYVQYQPWCTAF